MPDHTSQSHLVLASSLLSLSLLLAACGNTPNAGGNVVSNAQVTEPSLGSTVQSLAVPTNGQEYILRNRCSGKVLEIADSSLNNYGRAQQATETGANNQRWTLEATGGGFYKVINRNSGKVLEVDGAGTADGSTVQQFSYGGLNNQQWAFTALGDEYYELSPKHWSISALDVNGASLANNAKVQLWSDNTSCAQDWKFEPTTVQYTSPIVIKNASDPTGAPATRIVNGVRYFSGNWESLSLGTAAVEVDTREPVVIENCNLRGVDHLVRTMYDKAHLIIRNCKGYGLNPNNTSRFPGRFLLADEADAITVENNYFQDTSGIYIQSWNKFNTAAPGDTVKVRYNYAKNINGRYSNGSGGWKDSNVNGQYNRVHFVVFNLINNISGVEIAWNRVENEPGKSRVEDVINMHDANGVSTSWIKIHNNLINGAYGSPVNDNTYDYSGGGIMLGDGCSSRYVEAYDNTVLETSNYGMAVGSGKDMLIRNNTILGLGKLADGTYLDKETDRGVYLRHYCGSTPNEPGTVIARDNTIGWGNPSPSDERARLDIIVEQGEPPYATGTQSNNTLVPQTTTRPFDPALITKAISDWENKAVSNGVVAGPR